ncbi:MAG: methyltransferase domain-containing protein [Candidatus Rokubacteria bacterium]|nr:methyltransferase domain-containing protein [Candidatus Rokubacteria bacterium]
MASRRRAPVEDFYDDHPISVEHVLASVRERGRGLAAPLRADDLFDFDQDHYGGIAAVDALATRARIGARSRVLDVCAGLAGPARFLAARRGCRVLAVELHAGRARGARRLTAFVRLDDRVRVVRGDATRLPVRTGSCDAGISQEALLHIEDKAAVLAECRRALVPGGRLAFTDWVARPRLDDGERTRLREWMAATTLQTLEGYRGMLGRAGFSDIHAEDLSDDWRAILRGRLEMYAGMRRERARQVGEDRYDAFLRVYTFFARLVEAGKLGGGRFVAIA